METIERVCILFFVTVAVLERSAHGRDVIVQLFEWSHADVAAECETFLGPHGVDRVQISPPQEHIQGSQWWTRYQPVSYTLKSRSGDEDDLRDMVRRCNDANVSVVVDAVTNHMASGTGTGLAGNDFGSRSYAAAGYNADTSMHHLANDDMSNCAVQDYKNRTNVQECDLTGLPDLCSECESVRDTLRQYLGHLVDIGVDGFRMDAAKHQDATSLGAILRDVDGAAIYQEVIEGVGEAVEASMYFANGNVTEFRFAQNAIGPCFLANDRLHELNTLVGGPNDPFGVTVPSESALVFLDNHDTQRGNAPLIYQKNGALYVLASVFMLAWPYGTPRVMSSYAFDSYDAGPPAYAVHSRKDDDLRSVTCSEDGTSGWLCEHRLVAGMFGWRATAADTPVQNWKSFASNQIAFARGEQDCASDFSCVAFVIINRDESATLHLDAAFAGLPEGNYCDVFVSDDPAQCPSVRSDSGGNLVDVSIPPMSALAVHVGSEAYE